MRVYLKVFTKSGRNEIKEIANRQFEVRTTAIPAKGMANEVIIKLLAKHFNTAKSNIRIVAGKTAREKIIDIDS